MLKIKKGIKKKIKGKKDKGKDDLFDPEQLAKFKKELEEGKKSPLPPDTQNNEKAPPLLATDHEQDEEWLKFKQLTSGVDDVLKKTTGDLDRIKSSSYFQRTSEANQKFASECTASSSGTVASKDLDTSRKEGSWIGFERRHGTDEKDTDSESEITHNEEPCASIRTGPETQPKDFQIPEEVADLDDSLFDTSFVDAVASGEIKLAYIPDSPNDDPNDDDPFDTSAVADVVKQIEEEEKQRKKRVNLGNTVDFLTKKTDTFGKSVVGTEKRPRPRPHNINLIGSFEDDSQFTIIPSTSDNETGEKSKDLFDEIIYSPSEDKSVSLIDSINPVCIATSVALSKEKPEEDCSSALKNIITEFDVISDVNEIEPLTKLTSSLEFELSTQLTDDDDEFALLAAESLHKTAGLKSCDKVVLPDSSTCQISSTQLEETEHCVEDEVDPFDTTFVEKLQPGTSSLKTSQVDILNESYEDDIDFNPRADEPLSAVSVSVIPSNEPYKPTDLLDTTESEHYNIRDAVILPQGELVSFETEQDPFDTSTIETVLPGKTELKLLEEELLNVDSVQLDNNVSTLTSSKVGSNPDKLKQVISEDDEFDDFDPRAGEVKVKSEHPLDIQEVPLCVKVLTPLLDVAEELDPFDTSIVTHTVLPGKVELRLLENELISGEPCKFTTAPYTSQSDLITEPYSTSANNLVDHFQDSNSGLTQPENPFTEPLLIETSIVSRDVFESHENLTSDKPLTPQQGDNRFLTPEATDFLDPFDTSAVDIENINKADLKKLEGELLKSTEDIAPTTTILQLVPVQSKPSHSASESTSEPPKQIIRHILETDFPKEEGFDSTLATPLQPSEVDFGVQPSFDDPFDTSIAAAIPGPCKIELKILEEELDVEPGLKRSVTDPDFNPRETVHPSAELTAQPLTPQVQPENSTANVLEADFDPFDTSHAVDLIPGKTELKILEAELL